MNPAATPTPVEDIQGDERWMSVHERFTVRAKQKEPEVLFVGDSLIANMQSFDFWEKMFVPMHCLNFGIGGDQTQHVLWRMQNGELENLSPKVTVLLCGTNNHGHNADQVSDGILEIVKTINQKQPQAQVIVVGIPPRGKKPNKLREKIAQINSSVEEMLSKIESAQFFPIEPSQYINSDGLIDHHDMHDYLHFTKRGYLKFCEPLSEEIQTLLKNFMTADSASCGEVGEVADVE